MSILQWAIALSEDGGIGVSRTMRHLTAAPPSGQHLPAQLRMNFPFTTWSLCYPNWSTESEEAAAIFPRLYSDMGDCSNGKVGIPYLEKIWLK